MPRAVFRTGLVKLADRDRGVSLHRATVAFLRSVGQHHPCLGDAYKGCPAPSRPSSTGGSCNLGRAYDGSITTANPYKS
jgi:hypothetical protein